MRGESYEVLANSCYGIFALPSEFVATLFAQFPPNSNVGAKLFPRIKEPLNIITPADTPHSEWSKYYVIHDIEPLTGEYQRVIAHQHVQHDSRFHYFATADMTTYYSLQNFTAYEWRTSVEILKAILETDIIGKEFGESLLRVEKVPIQCGFHIINDAGKEEVVIDFPV